MSVWQLFNLQGTLFIMILAGVVLKKLGILDASGKKTLTDLCVDIVIPCNIIKSFLVDFKLDVLRSCIMLLVVGFLLQLLCVVFNKFLFNRYPEQQRKVLQYCTIVSMSGFLGNPVVEGVFGDLGLLYTAMFLIPMRVVMWSAGTTYFVAGSTEPHGVLVLVALQSLDSGVVRRGVVRTVGLLGSITDTVDVNPHVVGQGSDVDPFLGRHEVREGSNIDQLRKVRAGTRAVHQVGLIGRNTFNLFRHTRSLLSQFSDAKTHESVG